MGPKNRRARLLFTFAFAVLGGFAGHAGAQTYLRFLDRYLRGESTEIFWIQQNPTQLDSNSKLAFKLIFTIVGALLGFAIERLAFHQVARTRSKWESMAPQDKVMVFGGLILGLLFTVLLRTIVPLPHWLSVAFAVFLCYMCVVALDSLKEQIRYYFPSSAPISKGERKFAGYRPKLLDTNVIIDGRIADICRAGFVEGPIFVPKFIIEELQQIADSSDSLKRARGRRGLDILTQMQKEMDLQIPDSGMIDPNEEVDARLVLLARQVGGAIITNDFNLNKVAGLQGVDVLNVNELANALKPVVLPGEEMKVTIIKEGKEKEQGIGYLDDGTMIVVEGARRKIDETLLVSVTSVLQTVQGKMIFAKIRENGDQGTESIEDSIRSYSGGRSRRKTR